MTCSPISTAQRILEVPRKPFHVGTWFIKCSKLLMTDPLQVSSRWPRKLTGVVLQCCRDTVTCRIEVAQAFSCALGPHMAQKTTKRTGIYLYTFFTNLFSECARASSYLKIYFDTANNVWHPVEHSQNAHTFSTHVKLGCCPQNYQTQQPPRIISTCTHCIQNDSNAVTPFLIVYMFQTHSCPRYPIMCGRYLIELSL